MRQSQRGVTAIGWIILLIPVAVIVLAGIRLVPIYLNYISVSKYMGSVASEAKGETNTAETLRTSLDKRFQVGYIDHPSAKEIDVHREGSQWVMIADYEDVAPLFGNLSLLVQFHKQVEVQ
jgi:hypothetical protein